MQFDRLRVEACLLRHRKSFLAGTALTLVSLPGLQSGQGVAFAMDASGYENLGTLGGAYSEALDVNTDGSVVVGWAETTGNASQHAFRWTEASGMVSLGTLGGTFSFAIDVNADGSVVVGRSDTTGDTAFHAFRWTDASGMADLGTLGGAHSFAFGVNADGSVVVGWAETTGNALRAFRWTDASGMADLGTLGGTYSVAIDVNADGSVVVGHATTAGGAVQRAFRWTDASGMVSVEDWLRANGVTVASDFTSAASGVSADGNVVVGQTTSDTAFIARVVPTVPGSGPTVPGAPPSGSGIIDVEQYFGTLAARPSVQIGLNDAGSRI